MGGTQGWAQMGQGLMTHFADRGLRDENRTQKMPNKRAAGFVLPEQEGGTVLEDLPRWEEKAGQAPGHKAP